MGTYRIILVDDEEEVREGIIRKIDWSACGFELVGSAENGQEALEIAEHLSPDVVITDIQMPFMNGLTLCKKLSEIMPATKLVIFSGYDDFEYAQQAIKYNVTEYILKPVNAQELTALLNKLRQELDNEIDEKRNIERLRYHYMSSLPVLREQFLGGLLEGSFSKERIDEQSKLYDEDLSAECWTVALLRADVGAGVTDNTDNSLIQQAELIPLSVKQIVDENLMRSYNFKSFVYSDCVALIAMLDQKSDILSFIAAMNRMCKITKRFLDINCSIGIGSVCENLTDLHFSYQGARSALDYRVLMGSNKAIFIDDMEPDSSAQLHFTDQDERELLSAIKLGTQEDIYMAVGKFIGRFRESRIPFQQCQLYLMEMASELLKVIRAYQLDMSEIFGKDFDGSFQLSRFESLEELNGWFGEMCLKISVLIRRERTNSSRQIVEKAKQFIAENYSNFDMSVEMLCDFLHVSPAYFSTIFKREMGMSFVNYLTNVRMAAAVDLLNTTEEKTYAISLRVGYAEPNYFSYVFKKQFGISPTKYRSSKVSAADA